MLRPFRGICPVVPSTCYVDLSAQVVGNVTLGEHSSLWMNAVLRGDVHRITVGSRSNIQDNAVLHGQRGVWPVLIGNGCTIGHGAIVHGCVLEDDVLIGMGAIVLNGARIGAGSIVAAGAVIPEGVHIPPGSLVIGVPGTVRRTLEQEDFQLIRSYAQNYVDHTAAYLDESGEAAPALLLPVAPTS